MKYTLREYLQKVDYKKLFYRVSVVALILIIVSGYIAYTRIYLTPERRFWMAMNNNLSVPSVVKSTETGGTGNKTTDVTRFTFGGQAAQDKVNSVGFKNATSESNVTTETITTPTTQYVKYLNIFSTEKTANGGRYNFDSIVGQWAKEAGAKNADESDNQRLTYLQPLITLAPFGNLTAAARQAVIADLKTSGAYVVDFDHVTYQKQNGQKYMTFSVKVKTKNYVGALQRYFSAAGYGEFPPLDPSGYPDNARVNAQFIVAMKNNTLSALSFNGQNENYGNYGVTTPIVYPANTISIDQLQQRLQSAQ